MTYAMNLQHLVSRFPAIHHQTRKAPGAARQEGLADVAHSLEMEMELVSLRGAILQNVLGFGASPLSSGASIIFDQPIFFLCKKSQIQFEEISRMILEPT